MQLGRNTVLGLAVGVAFCLMRAAKADGPGDWAIAFALTLVEWATVAGVSTFSSEQKKLATAYRRAQAQVAAVEEAISRTTGLKSEEEAVYATLLTELHRRDEQVFDVERLASDAEWLEEAAHRGAIESNQRALEGGRLEAFSETSYPNPNGRRT